jgi:hypothetical protein
MEKTADLNWRKASYSGNGGGNCVEIAALPNGGRAVRDSKDPNGTVLILSAAQWDELRGSILRDTQSPPKKRVRCYEVSGHAFSSQ